MSVVGKCFLKGKVLNEREIERVIAQRATWGFLKDGGGESEGCWGNNSKRVVLSIESAIARRKPRRNLDLGDEGQRRDGECDLKEWKVCIYRVFPPGCLKGEVPRSEERRVGEEGG